MSHSLPDAMHWQLYQAYLRGPHSLFDVFEQAVGRQALCGTEEPEQQRTINSLSEQIARLQAQIERLQAGIRDFHHHNFRLGRRNAEIEAVVSKDSHNSSGPPSTDPDTNNYTRSNSTSSDTPQQAAAKFICLTFCRSS